MAEADADCPPEPMDSEDLLYLLYTSGTTAKPKGIMHTTGGYLTQVAFTHKYVFDLHPETDVYWCAADIGWVTGHSYIVYGPLANGATSVMYEGTPDTPGRDRCWDIVERYGVTILYTAPTAIRTFMKWGTEEPEKPRPVVAARCSARWASPSTPRRGCGTTTHIGGERCPIVDTWWQTETGAIMISAAARASRPPSRARPPSRCPASAPRWSTTTATASTKGGGYLTLTRPWPSMLRGIYGDPERYQETYWSRFEGRYFAGDGAKIDDDGYLWLLGRVDDVMNVSGHRISTTEVESALVDHPAVAEAAVVGANDDTTGQAIVAYVILQGGIEADATSSARSSASTWPPRSAPTARPKTVIFTDDLPKTRCGKIMRRLLRDVAEGRDLGDTTTLADPGVVEEIRDRAADGAPGGLTGWSAASPEVRRWHGGAPRRGRARARGRVRHGRRAVRRRRPPALLE